MNFFKVSFLWAVIAFSLSYSASAQIVDDRLCSTDGRVNAFADRGDTIYLGGSFSNIGPVTGEGVVLDTLLGGLYSTCPKIVGTVYDATSDGSGGWYVAGSISQVGDAPRFNIAHIKDDNTVDLSWAPIIDGPVYCLIRSGSLLYVGGHFSTVDYEARQNIAAIDVNTGIATSWAPNANNDVYALAVSGTNIYVGGYFAMIAGEIRMCIAAVDSATGEATAWDPSASHSVYHPWVGAIAIRDSTVYVGGYYDKIGGESRSCIAAIGNSNNHSLAWNPGSDAPVLTLAVSDSLVYAGGRFSAIGMRPRHFLAALDRETGIATTWFPEMNDYVMTMEITSSRILVGGSFTTAGAKTRNRVAAYDLHTGALTTWNPNANKDVRCLRSYGEQIFAGGKFSSIARQRRTNLAAIDRLSGRVFDWNPDSVNTVNALARRDSILFVGGETLPLGTSRSLLAYNLSTGSRVPWNSVPDSRVYELLLADGKLFVGGVFSNVGGHPRSNLAAIDPIMDTLYSWQPDPNGFVEAMVYLGSTLYVGGGFTMLAGVPRNHIGAVDSVGNATPWDPSAEDAVLAMAAHGSTIYAGGAFFGIGGQPFFYLAALDAVTGQASNWNPNPNGFVRSLCIADSTLLVGGQFASIGSTTRRGMAVFNVSNGGLSNFDLNIVSGPIVRIGVSGSSIYLAGEFDSVLATAHSGFAALLSVGGEIASTVVGRGVVIPGGKTSVGLGLSRRYLIVPENGWHVDSLTVDGLRVDSLNAYTFSSVTFDHTLTAYFSPDGFYLRASVRPGWNLVSVPVEPLDPHQAKVFPGAISDAFAYEGAYTIKSMLEPGRGYWIRFDSSESEYFVGSSIDRDTVNVVNGWNMIGSLSSTVRVDKIVSNPGGMATSNVFGYDGGYKIVDSLLPGHGYWIKAGSDGQLVLSRSETGSGILREPFAASACIRRILDGFPPAPPSDEKLRSDQRGIPAQYALAQNYPNPFNPTTQIEYSLPVPGRVVLRVYNVIGQEVRTLVDEVQSAGYKKIEFNAQSLPTGVYFYRFQAGSFNRVMKMVLIR